MSKVIRLSTQTISALDRFRYIKASECDDPLIKRGFLNMSDDDLIRFVIEDLLSLDEEGGKL